MLQINTKQNTKLVEIDGLTYKVRRPGAGESLTMQKHGREIGKLAKIETLTESQQDSLEDMSVELLRICLDLFQSDDPKALDYIQTLDVEILLDVINQVFVTDEPQVS